VLLENKTIDFPLLGKFVGRDNEDVVWVPSLDFIDNGRFRFRENELNISPLSKYVPKTNVTKLSLGQLSSQCGFPQEQIIKVLKDIITKFIGLSRFGKECVLNLKIG
jgi:hypothetical protein